MTIDELIEVFDTLSADMKLSDTIGERAQRVLLLDDKEDCIRFLETIVVAASTAWGSEGLPTLVMSTYIEGVALGRKLGLLEAETLPR